MKELMGYCKECGSEVYKEGSVAETSHVYECSVCSHPHAIFEIWPEPPSYIPEALNLAFRRVYGQLSTEHTEEF